MPFSNSFSQVILLFFNPLLLLLLDFGEKTTFPQLSPYSKRGIQNVHHLQHSCYTQSSGSAAGRQHSHIISPPLKLYFSIVLHTYRDWKRLSGDGQDFCSCSALESLEISMTRPSAVGQQPLGLGTSCLTDTTTSFGSSTAHTRRIRRMPGLQHHTSHHIVEQQLPMQYSLTTVIPFYKGTERVLVIPLLSTCPDSCFYTSVKTTA